MSMTFAVATNTTPLSPRLRNKSTDVTDMSHDVSMASRTILDGTRARDDA